MLSQGDEAVVAYLLGEYNRAWAAGWAARSEAAKDDSVRLDGHAGTSEADAFTDGYRAGWRDGRVDGRQEMTTGIVFGPGWLAGRLVSALARWRL